MELYIIRHGQSTNNATEALNRRDRVSDPPLTEIGHRQAEAVARYLRDGYNADRIADAINRGDPNARSLRGFDIDKLYCSPMHRTLQTARPIADALGLTPHVWVDIHEHGGLFLEHEDERGIVGFPGKTRAEILDEFPGYVLTDDITDEGWWTGTMEDLTTAYGRAIRVAEQLYKEAKATPDERIAIVSHGTFITGLLKALLNTLPSRGQWFSHHNTGMTRVDFLKTGEIHIRYINRVDHLSPELIT